MILLRNEQQKSNENSKIFSICQKKLKINMWKIKKVINLEIIAIIQGNIEVLHTTEIKKTLLKRKQHSTKSRIVPFKYFTNTLLVFIAMKILQLSTKSRIQPFKYFIHTNIYYHDNITANNF